MDIKIIRILSLISWQNLKKNKNIKLLLVSGDEIGTFLMSYRKLV